MDNEKIILFMGRLVYEKGVQHLISAMPKILSGYNDAKLIIAGKGGMTDQLKAQVDSMGLGQKVYFTGYLNAKQVLTTIMEQPTAYDIDKVIGELDKQINIAKCDFNLTHDSILIVTISELQRARAIVKQQV